MSDGRSYAVPGNDLTGYIGVDPEYQNYANESERPILTPAEIDEQIALGNLEWVETVVPAPTTPEEVDFETLLDNVVTDEGNGEENTGEEEFSAFE